MQNFFVVAMFESPVVSCTMFIKLSVVPTGFPLRGLFYDLTRMLTLDFYFNYDSKRYCCVM